MITTFTLKAISYMFHIINNTKIIINKPKPKSIKLKASKIANVSHTISIFIQKILKSVNFSCPSGSA